MPFLSAEVRLPVLTVDQDLPATECLQDCNIFGGEKSCKNIPAKSKFGSACKPYREGLRVDCAYFSDSEKQMEIHPGDALRRNLGSDSYNKVIEHCPECVNNLQALVRIMSITAMFCLGTGAVCIPYLTSWNICSGAYKPCLNVEVS